jgi:glycosyltransferase involved in cell wall biosynthesis
VTVYPSGPLPYGNDMVRGHAGMFEADVVVSLMDVWVQEYWGRKLSHDNVLFCPWLPVDQEPAPRLVVERLHKAHQPIAMSLFGRRMLQDAGVANVAYVPHVYDQRVHKPGDRAAARRALGLPEDRYIIGMVMANKGTPARKCWAEQLRAYAELRRRLPQAWLYLHTLLQPTEQGIDLERLLANLGLEPGRDYGYTNAYEYIVGWQESRLATLMQAVDILSNASMGEGFGVPILEAQACGTPVVTTACTSMPELTWAGVCVEKTHPYWTPLEAWAYMPDVPSLVEAYQALYERLSDPAQATELRTAAVRGAAPYEAATVRDAFWAPLLAGWREARAA